MVISMLQYWVLMGGVRYAGAAALSQLKDFFVPTETLS